MHLYVESPLVHGVLARWKPQAVQGHLLSLSGDEQYTRARLMLEQHKDTYGLWAEDGGPLFLCREVDGASALAAVCWTPHEVRDAKARRARFASLDRWYARTASTQLIVLVLEDPDRLDWYGRF